MRTKRVRYAVVLDRRRKQSSLYVIFHASIYEFSSIPVNTIHGCKIYDLVSGHSVSNVGHLGYYRSLFLVFFLSLLFCFFLFVGVTLLVVSRIVSETVRVSRFVQSRPNGMHVARYNWRAITEICAYLLSLSRSERQRRIKILARLSRKFSEHD